MRLLMLLIAFAAFPGFSSFADEWRPDLIARYESDGGRNIPNFRYDETHTAGGVCQMTNTTWREIAPTIDIDIVKFPNAGSASEHQQWQACWKLHAVRGNQPWTCCNKTLARHLAKTPSGPARPQDNRKVGTVSDKQATLSTSPQQPEQTSSFVVTANSISSSFVITGQNQ